jgi:hypothetical protein
MNGFYSAENQHKLQFIQHNANRQITAHHAVLQQAVETATDVVLLQEPYCPSGPLGYIALQHSAFYTIPPTPSATLDNFAIRPRVLTYIRKNPSSGYQFNARYDLCSDPDLQVLKAEALGLEAFYIVNIYNEQPLQNTHPAHQPPSPPGPSGPSTQSTDQRALQGLQFDLPTVLAGDFNRHHFWWNSAANPAKTSTADEEP